MVCLNATHCSVWGGGRCDNQALNGSRVRIRLVFGWEIGVENAKRTIRVISIFRVAKKRMTIFIWPASPYEQGHGSPWEDGIDVIIRGRLSKNMIQNFSFSVPFCLPVRSRTSCLHSDPDGV